MMRKKIINTAITIACILAVVLFITSKLRSCGNHITGGLFNFPSIDLGFLDGLSFLDIPITPDSVTVIDDYTGPVDTVITAGGQIEDGHLVFTEMDPETHLVHVTHYDLPQHGPTTFAPLQGGGFVISQKAVGAELSGTIGVSTRGWSGTLEVVYFNDLFGIDDLNPHIAVSCVSSYEDLSDIQVGIGLDFDLFPDYTNFRGTVHYTTDFSDESGVTFMVTTEIFSID